MFKNLSLKNKLAISASIAIIVGGVLVEAVSFNAALGRLRLKRPLSVDLGAVYRLRVFIY